MELKLTRPLVVFDLETTGLNVAKDRIVELSYIRIMPDGSEEQRVMRFNPEVHIPIECSKIHGIYDEDVQDAPTFRDCLPQLEPVFTGCDLAGFNSNRFDIPLLAEEFYRAGSEVDLHQCHKIDVQNIYHKRERRTLIAAYKHYCGKDLEKAHSADADTLATYEVLKAQLDYYTEDPLHNDVEWLERYSTMNSNIDFAGALIRNEKGEPVIAFGKHKGKTVQSVFAEEPGYYGWMMGADFAEDTKRQFRLIYETYQAEQKPKNNKAHATAMSDQLTDEQLQALRDKFKH